MAAKVEFTVNTSRCNNIEDFRLLAKRRLPSPIFHYLDGGSDDETTLRQNTLAYERYELLPEVLKRVDEIDTSTTILGQKITVPYFISPTGMSRLFHHTKESAVARAAAKFGTFYTLSTLGTTSLEEIGTQGNGPKMFQIYILRDRGLTKEFVERCKAANYHALCLTVDVPLAGNRERDRVTGMTLPPRFTAKSFLSFATHPHWTFNLLRHPDFRLSNVVHKVDALGGNPMGLIEYVNSQFDRTVTWDDVSWLIKEWNGPFVIKGILTEEDAKQAVDLGATAVMISNHGGRQLDGIPAPIDCISSIRHAVGDKIELIVDGGIRRGTHILKALALGADAVSIGRPYLYGLAANGELGVQQVLTLLNDELRRDMALLGCKNLSEVTSRHIRSIHGQLSGDAR